MHNVEWLMDQYPIENQNKPLMIVHGDKSDGHLKQWLEVYPNITLIKVFVVDKNEMLITNFSINQF